MRKHCFTKWRLICNKPPLLKHKYILYPEEGTITKHDSKTLCGGTQITLWSLYKEHLLKKNKNKLTLVLGSTRKSFSGRLQMLQEEWWLCYNNFTIEMNLWKNYNTRGSSNIQIQDHLIYKPKLDSLTIKTVHMINSSKIKHGMNYLIFQKISASFSLLFLSLIIFFMFLILLWHFLSLHCYLNISSKTCFIDEKVKRKKKVLFRWIFVPVILDLWNL